MNLYNTSRDRLSALVAFVSSLSFAERKALITLSRSQSVPSSTESPILFDKTKPILDKLVRFPPFTSIADDLLPVATLIFELLSSPLTTGLLIVFALGVELDDSQIAEGRLESFNKELLATQTSRRELSWNWDAILNPQQRSREVIHPLFPHLSPLQRQFGKNITRLKSSLRGRIILPHYTNRGVSSETASLLLNRVSRNLKCHGPRRTLHRQLEKKQVTSRDIVHHYVRTGDWVFGRTEMKQRWYPSGILPRTYFAWGGVAIAQSSYLRQFFNDLGDVFDPSQRRNRVQPDWLSTDSDVEGGYLFYDLTSFTSWFHEHVSFLRSTAELFSDVTVFLVGEDLSLSQHDLRSLILGYVESVNDYPDFYVSNKLVPGSDELHLRHQCAGFLGIPGNLITCTLPHALALATFFSSEHDLQVPGDDVGCRYVSDDNRRDIGTCASTLGTLQFEKVFFTPQTCVYLKRLVVDLGTSIELAPMLIYPLLPYLINPNDRQPSSGQFRLPDKDRLLPRAATVLVSFQRDLWKMTKGNIDSQSSEIILLLLRTIHDQVGLPQGAIFQGRLYGLDEENDTRRFPHIPVKFPVDEDHILFSNPDVHFANKFVNQMIIRSVVGLNVRDIGEDLSVGETVIVKNNRGWRFLEDMGYVKIVGIPGEKLVLVGEDARDAYLFASEPPFSEIEVLCDIHMHQLVAAGVVRSPDTVEFEGMRVFSSTGYDVNLQSWRYRKYVDLDDPRGAGILGKSREWVNDRLTSTRASLTPEPTDFLDY